MCNLNNGQDVHFAQYDYRKKNGMPPEIWYIDTPHFSRTSGTEGMPVKTVALFNLTDEERVIRFQPEDLKLAAGDYILTDVWTGKQYSFGAETEFKLPVHGSMLLAVSKTGDLQVFDANIRLEKISATENEVSFAVDYEADAELLLNRNPSRIACNGAALEFTQNGNITSFHLPEKGTLTIGF